MEYCPHYEGMDRVCKKCFESVCSRELSEFEKFVNTRWDYLGNQSAEDAFALYSKKLEKKKNQKNYLFLTLSPDKKLRNIEPTESNINFMHKWVETWCGYAMKKYYNGYRYAIESGHGHLHVHLVIDLRRGRRHAEDLKKSWGRNYPNSQLLTTLNLGGGSTHRGEYCYLRFDDEEILQQKFEYLVDELKEEAHKNQHDLGLTGSGGSFKYNGSDPRMMTLFG